MDLLFVIFVIYCAVYGIESSFSINSNLKEAISNSSKLILENHSKTRFVLASIWFDLFSTSIKYETYTLSNQPIKVSVKIYLHRKVTVSAFLDFIKQKIVCKIIFSKQHCQCFDN